MVVHVEAGEEPLERDGDHFAVRSFGWELLATSSVGHLPGMAIVLIGVVTAL